jgi:hypothetical protein
MRAEVAVLNNTTSLSVLMSVYVMQIDTSEGGVGKNYRVIIKSFPDNEN